MTDAQGWVFLVLAGITAAATWVRALVAVREHKAAQRERSIRGVR